jgi:predicted CoA-binding protein
MKKTLIIGASANPERYSYRALHQLQQHGHPVLAIGLKQASLDGVTIETGFPVYTDVDTVTLYVAPEHQSSYYSYILGLHPKRIIFNPGTENPEFMTLAQKQGIEALEACTLVMLSIGNF